MCANTFTVLLATHPWKSSRGWTVVVFYGVIIEHNNRFKCTAIDTDIRRVRGRMTGQSKWTGKGIVSKCRKDGLLIVLG